MEINEKKKKKNIFTLNTIKNQLAHPYKKNDVVVYRLLRCVASQSVKITCR